MFTLPLLHFCSYPFMICIIRMMSVWRMLQNARHSSHITPSPGQTDRQLSVSGHALMCCVSVWPHEAPLSQSEARMVTHWPIRGQDWADHDTDAVMSGVMRGEAVTGPSVRIGIQILHWIVHPSEADSRWGKLGWCRGWTPPVNTGRNIQLSVKFIPLVQDCSCGVTHTPNAYWDHFLYIQNILQNWIAMKTGSRSRKNILSL